MDFEIRIRIAKERVLHALDVLSRDDDDIDPEEREKAVRDLRPIAEASRIRKGNLDERR